MPEKKTRTTTKTTATTPANIEDNLAKLQKIVTKLERGKDNLDAAMQDYEQGIKLVQTCKQQLDSAEQKVEILSAANKFIDYEYDQDADDN